MFSKKLTLLLFVFRVLSFYLFFLLFYFMNLFFYERARMFFGSTPSPLHNPFNICLL